MRVKVYVEIIIVIQDSSPYLLPLHPHSLTLLLFFMLRIFTPDRVIQMNMEISLLMAHVMLMFPFSEDEVFAVMAPPHSVIYANYWLIRIA